MPESPKLSPFYMEEWRLYSEPVPGDQVPHAVFKCDSSHHTRALSLFLKNKKHSKRNKGRQRELSITLQKLCKNNSYTSFEILYMLSIFFF